MTRLFVCEFITGGGCLGAPLPAALAAEGAMMRDAVLRDLLDLGRHELTITCDARLPGPALPVTMVRLDGDPWEAWRLALDACEQALIIAPESDGILERFNALVLARGRRLLGCDPSAVGVTASKLATARRLAAQGVTVAATAQADAAWPDGAHGWVVKPDDGAGSEDTFFVAAPAGAAHRHAPGSARREVVQPYLPGTPISLSVVYGRDSVVLLGINAQVVERDGDRLRQTGVVVNGCVDRRERMRAVAEAVGRAVPGLRGYVGIDLIDTVAGAVVIEINPRLTTAYVGLRESLSRNPAALMLEAFGDEPITPPDLEPAKAVRVDMK